MVLNNCTLGKRELKCRPSAYLFVRDVVTLGCRRPRVLTLCPWQSQAIHSTGQMAIFSASLRATLGAVGRAWSGSRTGLSLLGDRLLFGC